MLSFLKKLFGLEKSIPVKPQLPQQLSTEGENMSKKRIVEVTKLYQEVLGREPDQGGLEYWVSTEHSIDVIREEFMKSDEFKAKMRKEAVANLYREVLKREPDQAGLEYWVSTPHDLDTIKVEFMKSDEYIALITPKVEAKPAEKPADKAPAKAPAKSAHKKATPKKK
ncbi:DUF4214 domain-containing protein [bacterium]|nr:DUF4214 domain-containing protein [bacterium]